MWQMRFLQPLASEGMPEQSLQNVIQLGRQQVNLNGLGPLELQADGLPRWTLAKQVPWIFRTRLKTWRSQVRIRTRKKKKKLFNSREQQLTGLRNTKKVSLCLFKGPPFTHSSAHFLSPVTWGSVQTHLASKLSSSHPMSRLISHPRTQHDFHVTDAVSCVITGSLMQEENSWLRWIFRTEVVERAAGPGSRTQRKASIYAESVGTEACQASMDHVRARSSLPGRTGDFLKNNSTPHWASPTACKPVGKSG